MELHPIRRQHFEEIFAALYEPIYAHDLLSSLCEMDEDPDWVAFGFDANPTTLGLIAVCPGFGEWYAGKFPAKSGVVSEILGRPKELALAAIRQGRWVDPRYRELQI